MKWWEPLFRRPKLDRDLDEEIRAHLNIAIDDRIDRGESPGVAARSARREFGSELRVKEAMRELWGWAWVERCARDVKYIIRWMRKNPSFTVVSISALALGIGANATMFGVVKAVLLNPLPYRDPGHLISLAMVSPAAPDNPLVDPVTAQDWLARTRSLESLSLYGDVSTVIVENGAGEIVRGLRINSNFFDTLGVQMELGRAFLPEEDRPDRRFTAVILSHGFWTRRFGGDPGIVGRVLDLGGFHYTVTGVLPASYVPLLHGTTELLPEIYLPAGIDYASVCRGCLSPRAIARLKPGVSLEMARAELNAVQRGLVREYPASYHKDSGVSVALLSDFLLGRVQSSLWAVLGAAGILLLIACCNVANMMLASGAARSNEIVLRAALGATRWDLIRQLLAESAVLAVAGGGAGFLLAIACTRALASVLPLQFPRAGDARLDTGVLGFTALIILATAIICASVPAWQTARVNLNEVLKNSSYLVAGSGTRRVLVVAEIALAFVLVSGALLLAQSFAHLMNVDPGYDPRNVLTLSSNIWGSRYGDQSSMLRYYDQALDRVRATSGVEGAAWSSMLPLDAADRKRFHIEERPTEHESDASLVEMYSVSAGYFEVMKIPLKRGRLFTDRDTLTSPEVALISETCEREQFPNEDAIGKRIQLGDQDPKKPWMTIVGVVGDIRQYGLDRPSSGEAYIAQSQDVIIGYYRLSVRTTTPPLQIQRAVQNALASVDPMLPVYHIKSMEDYLAGTLAARTIALVIVGLFGLLAMALAAVGVYGLFSYRVTQRAREIGVRIALGAERKSLLWMVLRESLFLAGIGTGIGFATSLLLGRIVGNLLVGLQTPDPATESATGAVLMAAALLASYFPARRASSVDPMVALRCE